MRLHDNIWARNRQPHRRSRMPRNADETRARLIRAAERLFAERGVEAV
jgi:AcrR family transcriptional regulator